MTLVSLTLQINMTTDKCKSHTNGNITNLHKKRKQKLTILLIVFSHLPFSIFIYFLCCFWQIYSFNWYFLNSCCVQYAFALTLSMNFYKKILQKTNTIRHLTNTTKRWQREKKILSKEPKTSTFTNQRKAIWKKKKIDWAMHT